MVEKSVVVTFKCSPEFLARVDKAVELHFDDRSKFIRACILYHLSRVGLLDEYE